MTKITVQFKKNQSPEGSSRSQASGKTTYRVDISAKGLQFNSDFNGLKTIINDIKGLLVIELNQSHLDGDASNQ